MSIWQERCLGYYVTRVGLGSQKDGVRNGGYIATEVALLGI